MTSPKTPHEDRVPSTKHRDTRPAGTTGREGEERELAVEELEERIAPRLSSNHNETLLVG